MCAFNISITVSDELKYGYSPFFVIDIGDGYRAMYDSDWYVAN